MSHHRPRSIISLAAAFLLVGGCDNPDAAKLTGHYSLESATSAQWTNGSTLTPPAITGVLLMDQSRFGQEGAYGSARMELVLSSGPMGGQSTNWSGSYTNGPGGEITMRLNDIRFTGEYVVDDDVLTTTMSADFSGSEPSPFGTLVWKRNPES